MLNLEFKRKYDDYYSNFIRGATLKSDKVIEETYNKIESLGGNIKMSLLSDYLKLSFNANSSIEYNDKALTTIIDTTSNELVYLSIPPIIPIYDNKTQCDNKYLLLKSDLQKKLNE